jgi:hypothetical protein
MQKFNKESYGDVLYVNFNEDVSSATAFTIKLNPQSGDELTKTGTLGTSDVWVEDQKFLANQYATYTTTDGVFDNWQGKWQYKGIATIAAGDVATPYVDFRVEK